MRFTPSLLEEIKARLPVSEVVRRRVQLKKSGREFSGLSPFSQEKSPSFFVNDQKMAWFDFSSGQNGNIFDFVMRTEGLTFPEAVERLAAEAGVPLPKSTPENIEREKKRTTLQEVLELSAKFFEEQLQARNGAKARGYLAGRGMGASVQKQFRLGYSPDERFALRDYLAGKGASAEMMIEAGMLIHGEDIAVPYDRFRDRVMFPICDRAGKVIAFGGRALEKDVPAKYLNSPETPLYHKGSVLYNQHNARKAAHEADGQVIVVEGYVDAIAMTGVGFANVVAPCGTALTPDQCENLWRMAEEPILCFDGDKAGRKAAHRAIDTALPMIGPGKSLRFAFLPDGQDPDDLARSGGQEAIGAVLAAARPLADVLWTRESEAGPLDTPERRAALERRLNTVVREITDETLRRYYLDDMRSRLDALLGPRRGGGAGGFQAKGQRQGAAPGRAPGKRFQPPGAAQGYRFLSPGVSSSIAKSVLFTRAGGFPARESMILLLFANHAELLARHSEDLASLECTNKDAARLRDALATLAADRLDSDIEIRAALTEMGLGPDLHKAEAMVGVASLWVLKPAAALEDAEVALQQALVLHRRALALNRELKSAELALAEDATEENVARLREIQSELSTIDGREAALEGFGFMSGRLSRAL
ncbi:MULTISPECIES: DNA primase [unclassified Beijerinckia]|uniref:DNA primase n=1 Tax=unclassified Beijerinckia TaxID=2638183 RepID=UPI000895972E|nr:MULTISPECIES: DNA primase [unclassified Beijerinckia]MDH7798619.1 DNA primase [Beijerinckia sp. GAS462]SED26919.1 DNA primase [Beijerinckia sp. 28-YEA-48]